MILEVILENGDEQLVDYRGYFPDALDAQEIAIFDPYISGTAYIYKWFVDEETHGQAVSLMKLKGLNVSVIERTESEISHIQNHRKFLSDTTVDTLAEDIVRLSGVGTNLDPEPQPIIEETFFGFQVQQVGYSTSTRSIHFPIDDIPDNGYLLDLGKLSKDEFNERMAFLNKYVVDQFHSHWTTEIIVENIPKDLQLQYILKFEKVKSVIWFRNDFIEYLQRTSGIKSYGV